MKSLTPSCMGLFLLPVPQAQAPPDTYKNFLHLHRGALWRESATSEFRFFTFWDLNKINDRKSKCLFSSVDFRTRSQNIHHSEINTSLSTLTQNLKEWGYENVHKMLKYWWQINTS